MLQPFTVRVKCDKPEKVVLLGGVGTTEREVPFTWEDGYVLSVIEADEKSYGSKKFFRVGRWKSGLFATSWIDNSTEQDENGVWSPYVKGRLRQS